LFPLFAAAPLDSALSPFFWDFFFARFGGVFDLLSYGKSSPVFAVVVYGFSLIGAFPGSSRRNSSRELGEFPPFQDWTFRCRFSYRKVYFDFSPGTFSGPLASRVFERESPRLPPERFFPLDRIVFFLFLFFCPRAPTFVSWSRYPPRIETLPLLADASPPSKARRSRPMLSSPRRVPFSDNTTP